MNRERLLGPLCCRRSKRQHHMEIAGPNADSFDNGGKSRQRSPTDRKTQQSFVSPGDEKHWYKQQEQRRFVQAERKREAAPDRMFLAFLAKRKRHCKEADHG